MHNRSEKFADLAVALAKAQTQFGTILKDKNAKIEKKTGGRIEYSFADLATVLDATVGPLNANQITLLQPHKITSEEVVVETLLVHSSEQWISTQTAMPLPSRPITNQIGEVVGMTRPTPQEIGSTLTYARRYGILAFLGLATEDDDGGVATKAMAEDKGRPAPRREPLSADPDTVAKWTAEIEDAASYGSEALKAVGLRMRDLAPIVKDALQPVYKAAMQEAKRTDEANAAHTNA